MSTRLNYEVIISDLENSKKREYIVDQALTKKLLNQELPKSIFSEQYIKQRKNSLCRHILDKGYRYEVIKPQIIIYKE